MHSELQICRTVVCAALFFLLFKLLRLEFVILVEVTSRMRLPTHFWDYDHPRFLHDETLRIDPSGIIIPQYMVGSTSTVWQYRRIRFRIYKSVSSSSIVGHRRVSAEYCIEDWSWHKSNWFMMLNAAVKFTECSMNCLPIRVITIREASPMTVQWLRSVCLQSIEYQELYLSANSKLIM